MNTIFKYTLLSCSMAFIVSNSVSASVIIHEQQQTPSYFQHENSITNVQLIEDSLSTINADEQITILETSVVGTATGGSNTHKVTVYGLSSGSQASSLINYNVIVNDYEQDITPDYILNSNISGTKLLEDAGIHIYSPSTVTLGGNALEAQIKTNQSAGSYSAELIVDGEVVTDVNYNIVYGNNIIIAAGTEIPVYSVNQLITAEQLFIDSGSTVDSNEDMAFLGSVATNQTGDFTQIITVIGLTTGASETVSLTYSVN